MRFSFSRRDFLRIGTVSLGGQGFPGLLTAGQRRARACILLYVDGGPSHIDLWDLKPDAPDEVRGPFRSVATGVAGVRVCEHLPRTAAQMHRVAQVRSVRHTETVHDPAVYQMLTGRKHVSSAGGLTVQPDDFPQMACALQSAAPRPAVMPPVIEIPETMKMQSRVLPGQNAGFLGRTHDPFRFDVPGEDAPISPADFTPHPALSSRRRAHRSSLLARLDRRVAALERGHGTTNFNRFREQALRLLDAPKVREAFDLGREPSRVRDTYGRHRHGQSVLLARRLVEGGARFVTVYWGKELQDWADGRGPRVANNPWDTHRNHFPLLKDDLLPRADQALAALVGDLHARGLLDETLVVWMGDFGRTPRITRQFASRDHWPHANTVLFAGAGVPGGAVIGKTDRLAAEVTEAPVSPADLTASIFRALGADPRATLASSQGQRFPLSDGRPIAALVG